MTLLCCSRAPDPTPTIRRWWRSSSAVAPHPCVRADFPYRRRAARRPTGRRCCWRRSARTLADFTADATARDRRAVDGRADVLDGRRRGRRAAPPPPDLRGLVLISYPLHPPGKPDQLRVEHLPGDRACPTLFISGTRRPVRHARRAPTLDGDDVAGGQGHARVARGQGHDLKGCDHTIAGAVK